MDQSGNPILAPRKHLVSRRNSTKRRLEGLAREELCSTDPTETNSNGKNKLLLLQQQTTEDQRIITVMSNDADVNS